MPWLVNRWRGREDISCRAGVYINISRLASELRHDTIDIERVVIHFESNFVLKLLMLGASKERLRNKTSVWIEEGR
jgi:hypothetical protein